MRVTHVQHVRERVVLLWVKRFGPLEARDDRHVDPARIHVL